MLEKEDEQATEPMHHREIILKDGRYMIFYTFGDDESNTVAETGDQGEDV